MNSLLRLIWLTTIPVLIYSVIKTPDLENMSYELGALHSATGGFGSNQVASVMGLGIFLSYYAWMNKLLFSGNHNLDGIFIAFFAYQGLLTFSRGGIIIALCAIIVYYYYFRNSENFIKYVKKKSLRPLLFFGFALMGIFLSYIVIESRSDGYITLRYLGETYGTISGDKIKTIDSFTTGRYSIVISDFKLWADNFIFGTGAGASKYARIGNLYGISPHTEITRLLAEHGVFGFIFIVLLLIISLKSMNRNRNSIYYSIIITLFFIGLGTALHSAMRTFITPIMITLSMVQIIDKE
ncbi:MAG: O-antigen ligase family protein [Candidatus Neomarinimicrobiota bacterium]